MRKKKNISHSRLAVESFNEIEKFAKSFINNDSITIVNDDNLTDINNHIYSVNYILTQIASKAEYYAKTLAL